MLITKEELKMVYGLDKRLVFTMISREVRIERPKMSVFKLLLSYSDMEDKTLNIFMDNFVNYNDLIDTMLEEGASDDDVLNLVEKIKAKWNLDTVCALAIMKQRFFLTQKLICQFKIPFKPVFVKIGIEFDSFDIVYLLKSSYPQSYTLHEKSYLQSLLLSFQRSNTFWIAKMQFLKSLMKYTNYIKAETFLLYTLKALENEDVTKNPMYFAPNILLFTCNLVEICKLLVSRYNFLGAYTEKIEDVVIKSTASFIEDIEDEFQLRELVFEKDYENRDALDLLSKYNIVDIMNNKNMEKIALELWTSQYDVKGSLFTTSSAMQIIVYDSFNKPRDILQDFFCLNWKYRKIDDFDHHICQFEVWKTSMIAKYITEGLFLTILTIVFQYYLMEATQSAASVDNSYSSYNNASDTTTQASTLITFTTYANSYYDNMQVTIILGYIALTFPIRILLTMAFAKKSKRQFEFLNVSNILDLLIFCVFSIRLYLEYVYYLNSEVTNAADTDERARKYYDRVFRDTDYSDLLDYMYCVASACLWLRIILLFRLTRFLGPLVKMIQNMMHDIFIFMILFITQMVVFASVGNLLFADTDAYGDFYSSIQTIFNAAMADYSFSDTEGGSKSQYLGHAFILVSIILQNILLLNLLIAILSSTYAMLEDKKLVLYINEILKLRPSSEYDERCSALVSTFPPWNVIALLFTPVIMFSKNPQTINLVLFHIEYAPMLIVLFIAYLVGNLLLIPLAYLKGIYVNLQQCWSNKVEGSVFYIWARLVIWIFFGILILFMNLIADLIVFFMHLYQKKMNFRKEQQKSMKLSIENYQKIKHGFHQEHKKGRKRIRYENVILPMKEEMNVIENIQNLIFGFSPKFGKERTHEESMKSLKEFVLIKKVLYSSCIPANGNLYVYPENMRSILYEMRMSMRLLELCKAWDDNLSIKKSIKIHDFDDPNDIKNQKYSPSYLSKFYHINLINLHAAVQRTQEGSAANAMGSALKRMEEMLEKFKKDIFDKLDSKDSKLERISEFPPMQRQLSRPMDFSQSEGLRADDLKLL